MTIYKGYRIERGHYLNATPMHNRWYVTGRVGDDVTDWRGESYATLADAKWDIERDSARNAA